MAFPDIQIGVDGYCTLAHVEALNPMRSYSSTTKPSRVQAAMAINDIFHQMNGILDVLGYQVAVSSGYATAIYQLRHINALAAASQIEDSTFSVGNTEGSSHADRLKTRFVAEWKEFREGRKTLISAPRKGNYIPKANERHAKSAFKLDSLNNEKDPVFSMDMDF